MQSSTFYPITEHEIRETRLLVEQYKLEIQVCNERIEELLALSSVPKDADDNAENEALLDKTINQKSSLERLLAQKSSLISPIRRLPLELLALIMICHVRDNAHTPWTLLAVCKSWRYLGLETPRLWSLIHVLQEPNHIAKRRSAYFVGGVVCRTEQLWNIAIDRSGVVPLDLIIECDLPSMPCDFFSQIILQSAPRCRSIVYAVTETTQPWDASRGVVVFPKLRSVKFLHNCSGGPVTDVILSAFESTSTKLHSMVIQEPRLKVALGNRVALLQRVREVDFTSRPYTQSFGLVAPGQENLLWLNLVKVEVLVLRDSYSSAFANRREDRFMKLRVFAAKAFRIQDLTGSNFQFKSLTHIYLERPDSLMEPDPHSIALVNVTHFGLVGDSYLPLCWFLLPSVILLELFGNPISPILANQELDLVWNFGTFGKVPSPITLHIETKANDAYLLVALRNMYRLKELCLYYDAPQAPSKFMESLAVKPKKGVIARGEQAIKKWVPPTCPELETLSLVYKKLSLQETVGIGEKLRDIREARLGTARELKEVRMLLRSEHKYQTSNLAQRYMERWPH